MSGSPDQAPVEERDHEIHVLRRLGVEIVVAHQRQPVPLRRQVEALRLAGEAVRLGRHNGDHLGAALHEQIERTHDRALRLTHEDDPHASTSA